MLTMLRHVLSILLLPFMAAVVVPYWLLTSFAAYNHPWNEVTIAAWTVRMTGSLVFIAGFALFTWCVVLFARIGHGTLAPWDPTRDLVAVGPYRFARNPMISGVALVLIGEALLWGSWVVGIWVCLFMCINHVYFIFSEEPGLEKRFGESYRLYKSQVPRWIPRLSPWSGK